MEGQELIHAVILSLLLFFGIITCGIYLASIKAGTNRVNATEALQICTLILVFFGLILFMPLEIYSLVAVDTHYQALCVARGKFVYNCFSFLIIIYTLFQFLVFENIHFWLEPGNIKFYLCLISITRTDHDIKLSSNLKFSGWDLGSGLS